MKIELQKKIDSIGDVLFWIYVDDSPQIPIYRDEAAARKAYAQIVEFHKNPPAPVVLESVTI